jgi:hypothetical protein
MAQRQTGVSLLFAFTISRNRHLDMHVVIVHDSLLLSLCVSVSISRARVLCRVILSAFRLKIPKHLRDPSQYSALDIELIMKHINAVSLFLLSILIG